MFILPCKTRGRDRLCLSYCPKQTGYSLLELLISLLVFSVGILGTVSIQTTSIRLSHEAYLNYQASLLASALAENIRINDSAVGLDSWQKEVSMVLPAGSAEVSESEKGYQIRIAWRSNEDQAGRSRKLASAALSEYRLDIGL